MDRGPNTSSALPCVSRAPRLNSDLRSNVSEASVAASALVRTKSGLVDWQASSFYRRGLQPSDRQVLKALHEEWFPLDYGEEFYDTSVTDRFFAIAICWKNGNGQPTRSSAVSKWLSLISGRPRPPVDPMVGVGVLSFDFAICTEDLRRVLRHLSVNMMLQKLARTEWDFEKIDRAVTSVLGEWTNSRLDPVRQLAGYILTLGVLQEFRGKGLGNEILMTTKDEMWRRQRKILMLHVASYNTAAIAMYQRSGFELADYVKGYYMIYGQTYDAYLAIWVVPGRCEVLERMLHEICDEALNRSLESSTP